MALYATVAMSRCVAPPKLEPVTYTAFLCGLATTATARLLLPPLYRLVQSGSPVDARYAMVA